MESLIEGGLLVFSGGHSGYVAALEPPSAPTRPPLRYHGGKWVNAKWIISHFPPHMVYVEPYGGAGSVLLQKPRAFAEVYNDLSSEVVILFRVLRSPPVE